MFEGLLLIDELLQIRFRIGLSIRFVVELQLIESSSAQDGEQSEESEVIEVDPLCSRA